MTITTPPLITQPFAAQGDQSVVPATDPNGFVNYSTGYTPDYEINLSAGDPAAKAVERGIQNYLFNILTNGLQSWQTNNRPPWYSSMPGGYAQYAEVQYPDVNGNPKPYRSLVAGNVSQPGSNSSWEYIEGTGEMINNIPMPAGGAAGPSSYLITQATDFNTLTGAGTYQYATDAVTQGSGHPPVNGGNAGSAGTLEVTAWTTGGSTYITQMFRDRNGLGFMRGATNGSWTAWKIWANAQQFTPGEIRMWTGSATEAAVQAAWGPGWHFCNGQNGTVDLRNYFILGAGNGSATGATGGASTVTLSSSNLPTHNHVINISDNGHTHGVNQTPHTHGVYDPGHAHGVYDPGHNHFIFAEGGWPYGTYGSGAMGSGSTDNDQGYGYSSTSGTGIGIYGNGTGISIYGANANISIYAANTGITASSQNTGSGNPFSITPPFFALTFVQYTGS